MENPAVAQVFEEVADLLDVGYFAIYDLIRAKRLTPPHRSSCGFLWSERDVARARQALATGRRRRSRTAPAAVGNIA